MNRPWAVTLYERYVQLYGDPIEQPMRPRSADLHKDEEAATDLPVNQNSTS